MTVLQLTSSEGKDENVEENLQSTDNMTAVEGTMGTLTCVGSGRWHERLAMEIYPSQFLRLKGQDQTFSRFVWFLLSLPSLAC